MMSISIFKYKEWLNCNKFQELLLIRKNTNLIFLTNLMKSTFKFSKKHDSGDPSNQQNNLIEIYM